MTGTLTTSSAVLPIFFITSLNPPVLLRYLLDTLRRYAPPVLLGGGGGLLGGPPVRLRGGGPGLRGGPPVLLGPYGPGLGLGGDMTYLFLLIEKKFLLLLLPDRSDVLSSLNSVFD